MNVRKRLTGHFIWQLIIAGVVIIILIIGTFYYIMNKWSEIGINQDFTKAGVPGLLETMSLVDGQIVFNERLLQEVQQRGGWLQTLNEQGEVTASYFTPEDVPMAYQPGELVSYLTQQSAFPYDLYIWMEYKGDTLYTLLYGVPGNELSLLQAVKQSARFQGTVLELPEEIKGKIVNQSIGVQVLAADGSELASFNKPDNVPDRYSVQELMLRVTYSERYHTRVLMDYDDASQQTWLLLIPIQLVSEDDFTLFGLSPVMTVLFAGLVFLLVMITLIFILLAIWYGHRFGTPMVHMMNWLQRLAQGQYDEPCDSRGTPRSKKRNSRKLKRKYRMYTDIIESLNHLTDSLKRHDAMRLQLQQTREEWITGVTHDMKTPLSSLLGYAHLLEAERYDWSKEEVRDFAAIIKEKAAYMDQLIADLSMTFRLENGAHPLKLESVEMGAFVEQCMIQLLNDPKYEEANVSFERQEAPLYYPIDVHGFRRIIDNLLGNAILHNPVGTPILVKLEQAQDSGFRILIQDEGGGMSEQTKAQLFERYYRGTNTEGVGVGTGLGMAIAKQLVIQHQGTIEVQSTKGKGTRIILTFKCK